MRVHSDQQTQFGSLRAYVKFYLRNYCGHRFYDHMFLGLLKETQYLNHMRCHGAYIENNCYH